MRYKDIVSGMANILVIKNDNYFLFQNNIKYT